MQTFVTKVPTLWAMVFKLSSTDVALGQPCVAITSKGKQVLTCTVAADMLELRLWTFQKDTPLVLHAPLALPNTIRIDWLEHSVTLSHDGIVVDEEWPIGSVFRDGEAYIRYNDKLISDFSVEDARVYPHPTKTIADPLYWVPQNYLVGDCMPFYDGEQYHLYFLKDLHHHQSKWALGAHQYAHISSSDLLQWVEHPLSIPITQQWEGSICTGSVIKKDQLYYAFYAVRMSDKTSARLTYATSNDGVHFTKSESYFELTFPYEQTSVRDPEVFEDEQGVFHMLVTTDYLDDSSLTRNGCLAHLTSNDLTHWSQDAPFIIPGYTDQPECANYFKWNNYYYLVFSNYGVARYRYSLLPFGPWIKSEHEKIDGWYYRVPKTAAFHNNRRIAAGFVCSDLDGAKYGGSAVLRELVQNPDGTLSTKFVDELYVGYQTIVAQKELALEPSSFYQFAQEQVSTYAHNTMVEITVHNIEPSVTFGIQLRSDSNSCHGVDIRFEQHKHKVGIYPKDASDFEDSEKKSIYGVNSPINKVILMLGKDYIDICVNDQYTLIARAPIEECNRLFACAKDGKVQMDIVVKSCALGSLH